MPLLRALSATYPTADAAIAEAAGLSATLGLPMGLVHIISDIHGEHEKLRHVIHNASGALRPLVEATLKGQLTETERQQFLAILYYPSEAIPLFTAAHRNAGDRNDWVHRTLTLQCQIIRALRTTYRRSLVDRLTPPAFRELFVEMLSGVRPDFPKAILAAMAATDRDLAAVKAAARLIRNLATAELLVAGDLGDRGPRIDKVIDILRRQPRVRLLWGNHDAIWMGSCLGHDACFLTVLRFSARYRRAAQLEEGYGILTTPLEKLVRECYADDPAEHFKAKGTGVRDELMVARMQKALAIMQFKAEGQLFARHPEWELDHRRLLHRIDQAKGAITLDGVEHALRDTKLPTLDPRDPYAYSKEEAECLDLIRASFLASEKLWQHMSWLARRGRMWAAYDDVLVFHACVPVDAKGEPLALEVDGRARSGRELMDALASVVRRAFRRGGISRSNSNPDADWLWYLWGGPRSPLFGKDKLATFESHFIADKETHKEHKNPYFDLIHDAEFVKRIGRLFGIGDEHGGVLVVNGHVPVKVEKGEQPVKRGGNAVTIDGAFSEAYGDRGYTMVLKPDRVELAEHAHFSSVREVVEQGADMIPKVTTIKTYPRARTVGDTDAGRRTRAIIGDLEALATAFEEGLVQEKH